MAATLALVAALFFFWLSVTCLFPQHKKLCLGIRLAGVMSGVAGALIFTPLHDVVIALFAPMGFVAIGATCVGLAMSGERGLFWMAMVTVSVAMTDYLAWILRFWQEWQPMIQKGAFLLVMMWIVAGALRVMRTPILASETIFSKPRHKDTKSTKN